MEEENQVLNLQKIIDLRDINKGCKLLGLFQKEDSMIKQGQFVFALHPFASPMQCIGFAVQVRKGLGKFGSDVTLIRLANGSLQAWENQSFFSMSNEQEELARQTFKLLPEEEDFSKAYGYNEVYEKGFVIEKKEEVEYKSNADSNDVNIQIKNGDSITHISFI